MGPCLPATTTMRQRRLLTLAQQLARIRPNIRIMMRAGSQANRKLMPCAASAGTVHMLKAFSFFVVLLFEPKRSIMQNRLPASCICISCLRFNGQSHGERN